MSINNIPTDLSDVPEITKDDFARAVKNPYAKKIREHGYSITIHYTPEYVAKQTIALKQTADIFLGLFAHALRQFALMHFQCTSGFTSLRMNKNTVEKSLLFTSGAISVPLTKSKDLICPTLMKMSAEQCKGT